jgi:hypothetical protein
MDNPLDSLNITLQGKDFERALLPDGQHPMQVTNAQVKPNKKGDNYNLVVESTIVNPTPSANKEGVTLEPGKVKLTTYDNIYQTEGQKEAGVEPEQALAQIIDAVFGTTAEDRPNLTADTLSQMIGRQFFGQVITENSDVYGKQSRLVRYAPVG